jgi:tetratricopeptide (TPR) repeat protein
MSRRNGAFLSVVLAFCFVAGLSLARYRDGSQPKTAHRAVIASNSISGMDHARLANDYIAQRKAGQALTELKEAEWLGSTNGFEFESSLFQAYCNLHQVASAIEHGQRCVALGKASGVKQEVTDSIQWRCHDLESRLHPSYFESAAPKEYTTREFNVALRRTLSAEEVKLAVNPIASTPEMASWARDLTAGANQDEEKARRLFDGLSHRLDSQVMQYLTAEEAFKNWTNSDVSFHCQDYAFLCTSLARAAGLKAFAAVVEETCYGEKTEHACAAVFFGKRALLVDPSYFWFGVPHKRFKILDDLSATALYQSCFVSMQRAQIAAKLAPELLQAQSDLFCAFVGEGRWNDAKSLLPRMKQLDADGWGTYCAEAKVAAHENRYEAAAGLLNKAIRINPSCGLASVNLGEALFQLGRYDDARESLLKSLKCSLDEDTINVVRQKLAWLDQQKDTRK